MSKNNSHCHSTFYRSEKIEKSLLLSMKPKNKYLIRKIFLFIILFFFSNFSFAFVKGSFSNTSNIVVTKEEIKKTNPPLFIDVDVKGLTIKKEPIKKNVLQLFTHGQPAHLLINGEWKNALKIKEWLMQHYDMTAYEHLNIYGCNFAKGEIGRVAVAYLEKELNISIAASNDLTGADGDWDLEVGTPKESLAFPNYTGNLQGYIDCGTIIDSPDGTITGAASKTVNGLTYLALEYDFNSTSSPAPPVVNGNPLDPTHVGDEEVYLAIWDADCNQILGTFFGGDDDERVEDLIVDSDGNIWIAGQTQSTDFLTTDGSVYVSSFNTFLVKYAPDGTLLFSTVIGLDDENYPDKLLNDGTDIFLAGTHFGGMDFPTTNGTVAPGVTFARTLFARKYDTNGNLIYSTSWGSEADDYFAEMILLDDGKLAVGGSTSDYGGVPFQTTDGSTIAGFEGLFLTLLDELGNITESKVYGDNPDGALFPQQVISDGAGGFYAGGVDLGGMTSTDGTTNATGTGDDIFLARFDSSANLLWYTILGGNSLDNSVSIKFVDGFLYFVGESSSTDLLTTTGTTNAGFTDIVVGKYDPAGNPIFVTSYGGSGSDQYPDNFEVNAAGEIYVLGLTTNAPTTDGSSGAGFTPIKFNADGSLCAATILPFGNSTSFTGELVITGDTIRFLGGIADDDVSYSTDGTVSTSTGFASRGLWIGDFVFCPDPSPVASDVLSPATINVCQNGIIEQIIGEEIVIDGATLPSIFIDGVPGDQPDLELSYLWQTSSSASGPWTDILGPLGQQQNYTPAPTVSDIYYRRLTKTSECCGGIIVSTSNVASILVGSDIAPTIDGGGTFYTCPSDPVTIGGSPTATGGTSPYSYNWNDGAFTVDNPAVSPTESTVYTVEVTDNNGCMQADQAVVTVYTAAAGADKDVCEGIGTTIGGTPLQGVPVVPFGSPTAGEYGIAYDWSPKDGSLNCTDCPNPTASPMTATDYTLSVTIYQPNGASCTTSDMVNVGVVNAPVGDLAAADMVLCLGDMAELSALPPPISSTTLSAVSQTDNDGGFIATVANLTDGDFATGGRTTDGTGNNITLDLGSIETINNVQLGRLGTDSDYRFTVEVSTDNITYTNVGLTIDDFSFGDPALSNTLLTSFYFEEVSARYIRLASNSNFRDAAISEFSASNDYEYIWTPGVFIATAGKSATFDAGNLEMPAINPITYTVAASSGECNFYDQVTVAVIEARAGEDACGPRIIGEFDRTSNINETYSWVKITDPSITTGTGDFTAATDELFVPVSASVGGDVGYELTVSYTLNGVTGICKDTVIVPPTCGPGGCGILVADGGCPDFDDGTLTLIAVPQNNDDADSWTYSWTSNEGMVGLDNYNTNTVMLTDNVTRTHTVTMTSVIDPSYTCSQTIEANSASFSTPVFNVTSPITTCGGTPVNIGDPANSSGLTYEWSNGDLLDDATISNPLATVLASTEFTVTVTDNVTGCRVEEIVQVNAPQGAFAGEDLVVCNNGTVTIGSPALAGYTYAWEPANSDWRNGTDENDAQPDVFVAVTQDFHLTVLDATGTCTTRDTITVLVEPLPPMFTLPDLNYCPTQTDPLVLGTDNGTATGTNQVPDGFTYTWSPNTVSDNTLQNPTINTPLPTGLTTYTVEIANPGGCNQKATQTIIPSNDPPAVINDRIICLGDAITIGDADNPTGGGITYSWSPVADLDDATSPNPTFTSSATGTFTYTLTKSEGGCDNLEEVTITVTELTAPVLAPHTICEGGSVQIGPSTGGLSYAWSPTTGLDNPFIRNPIFSGTSTTNYTLTIIDNNGCTAETNTRVTVNPAPVLTVTLPDTTICDAAASSIVINAGVNPAGNYAYQWTPTDNLSNANALNPSFFIPGEGDYEYTLEVIDQATGCSITENTIISVQSSNLPEVIAFAIQPSCVNDVPQSDGYLQISEATFGDRYHWSAGSTFDDNGGAKTFANATSLSGATYPVQFNMGLSNADVGDFTIRVYSDAADCFTDVVVTLNVQDCTAGCDCEEIVYLNEIGDDVGRIHKFLVDTSAGLGTGNDNNLYLREITSDGLQSDPTNQTGIPWYEGNELPSPHGLGTSLNGYVYIGETFEENGDIRRLNCNGMLDSESDFVIEMNGMLNIGSIDNLIISNMLRPLAGGGINDVEAERIAGFDACTGALLGEAQLGGSGPDTKLDWGLYIDPRTDSIFVTTGFSPGSSSNSGSLYKFSQNEILNNATVQPFITNLPGRDVRGVVTDPDGFIYIVLQNDDNTGDASVIYKYNSNGTQLLASSPDGIADGTGYNEAIGIVYSEALDLLFVSTESLVDDCISVFSPDDLSYIGTALPAPGTGSNGKAIAVNKECCPVNNNIVIDTTFCSATINDVYFLQEIINCRGGICEGFWEEEPGNTGLIYDNCNNTVTVADGVMNGCGTFILESDGTGNNSKCGAFKITVNISINEVIASVIAGDQTVCEGGDPATFTVTTPAMGGTLSYQWQSSTTDCMTDFVDIPTATAATYDPPAGLTDTTFYRVLVNSENAGCTTGMCADTSNCVTVMVNSAPTLAVTPTNPSTCTGSDGSIAFTFTNVPDGTYTINYMDGVPSAQTFTNVTVTSGMATVTGLNAGVYNDLSITVSGCTSMENVDITLTEPNTPTLAATPFDETCALNDGSIQVTISGGASPFDINWSDGGSNTGSIMDETSPYTITNLVAGNYNITVTDDNGCINTTTATVNAPTSCCPSITNPTASQSICESETVASLSVNTDGTSDIEFISFTAPQTGTGMYDNAGASLGVTTPTGGVASISNVSFASPGTFYVYAILSPTPADGSCRPSQEIQVTVNSLPNATLMLSDSTICLETDAVPILSNSEVGVSYQLRNDADDSLEGSPIAGTGGDINFTISNLNPEGTYTFNVLATNITSGCSTEISDLAVINVQRCDFQDYLPTCANPPCHLIDEDLYIGSGVSSEASNQGSVNADTDDDDGILIPNNIRPGITIQFPTTIFNNTGQTAYLTGWVDWNGDQDFNDPGEQIANEAYDAATFNGSFQVPITVQVPNDAVQGQNIAVRYRLSTAPADITSPCGVSACAADGEIEDYLIMVECPPQICLPVQITINKE